MNGNTGPNIPWTMTMSLRPSYHIKTPQSKVLAYFQHNTRGDVEVTALMCKIPTIIITLSGPEVPSIVQLGDKNKMGCNSIQTQHCH